MSRLVGKNRDTRLVNFQKSSSLGNKVKTGAKGISLLVFLLVWMALAMLPVLIVAHFVIKYW